MTDRTYDLLDPQTHVDPWPMYTWLREEAPLYWDSTNEVWAVSRYDDVVAVSKDPTMFTSMEGNRPRLPADPSFIHLDGPPHRDYRGLIQSVFGGTSVAAMRSYVKGVATELLDEVLPLGKCEFVGEVGARLPMRVIAELVGHRRDEDRMLIELLDRFVQGGNGPLHVTDDVNDAFFAFAELHEAMVAERRERPRGDMLSLWVCAEEVGLPYEEMQLLFEHTMVMVGGSETTRNAIAGGLIALWEHPDQWEALRRDRSLIPNAVEEVIRWVTPFVSMSRTATQDVPMHGKVIEEGQEVMMLYPPANRDPRHFVDPERFDIRRDFTSKSLSFGYGPHFCLGAHLARLEVGVLFEEILDRAPYMRLDPEVEHTPWLSSFVRGPRRLPVRYTPSAPAR